MATSGAHTKRPASSFDQNHAKRIKRHYHHHHRLQEPVILPSMSEPVVQDDTQLDQLMNRAVGQTLKDSGFELADPAALSSLCSATEEYMLRLSTFIRQSMLSARRIQPIPHDFDHALKRLRLNPDDLLPHLKTPFDQPKPTLLPSPPPENEISKSLPFLTSLSSEDDRASRPYIPKHFPSFPSKHTYSATAVFIGRDNDPRKIRERAAEDGRHGEEALRKLAGAAFRDNQTGSTGRDKKLWGRRMDSMESMFEKTIKGLSKKHSKDSHGTITNSAMDIDSGHPANADTKPRLNISELGPIVNCERDLWRQTSSNARRREDKTPKPLASVEPADLMIDL
ncbi:transcriptional regulator family: Bromodomain transcription factor [Penicillium roqueforti]|nr:transcriptional regulator family: Bromodomain transcription factor [Penicillium roqueforti]KAI3117489.1 transcriptional regulator family: Bromodomain transcription factor [Penicillium roqueforti]